MRNVSINDRTTPLSPIIKSEPVNQDQPLDFSKRVRHSAEDDSLRKVSEDSAVGDLGRKSPHAVSATSAVSEGEHRNLIGEPRVVVPGINSFLPQTAMPGMGMFYPNTHVFPNFMAPGFPPMWPNPMAAAAMMQQHQEAARKLLQQTANNKSSPIRPFGAARNFLGKDTLPMAGGIRNLPPIPSATGLMTSGATPNMMGNVVPDPTILAEALKSHEEMYNAYKQQVSILCHHQGGGCGYGGREELNFCCNE